MDLRTHVVLRNMSAGSVGVSATASFTRGNAVESVPLPDLKLAGNAVGEYDLSALQRRGAIPRGVSEVLLKVDYFAVPGSLMGRAYSISSDLSFGLYSVLETDGTGYFSGVYWSLKDDENTVFTVANIGDKEEAVALNLAYAGGAVELPAFPLLPGQSQTVNLRRDLARTLQGAGKALPEGAVFGGYQVRSVEDPLRAELVVKEHVLSASKKTAAPFYGSCNYVTSIWLSVPSSPISVPLGGTTAVSPKCTWNTGSNVADYGATLSPDGGNEISISPTYGYTRTITGLNLGTRNLLQASDVPAPDCTSQLVQGSPPPASVTSPQYAITTRAFIMPNNIGPDPTACLTSGGVYFKGDQRGFSSSSTKYRTQQKVTFRTGGTGSILSHSRNTGQTRSYASNALSNGSIGSEDEDGVANDCSLWHAAGSASTAGLLASVQGPSSVRIYGGAANPLVPGSPDIDADYSISFPSATQYSFVVAHDCYPAHEAYIGNKTIYTFMPASDDIVNVASCLLGVFPVTDLGGGFLP